MNTNHTLKIFVVDDDEFFGTIVKSTLEREENIEVVLFTNAVSYTHLTLPTTPYV